MQFTYDPVRNIAYLRLRDAAGGDIETISIGDEVNVDMAADGSVYGIELLNANAQLHEQGGARLILDLAGRHVEVPLPELA